MHDNPQSTLHEHLANWRSNPAMHTLVSDYAKYHLVLVIVGSFLLLALVLLSVLFWIRFAKTPGIRKFTWPFEKKVYFSFGFLSIFVALLLAVIVVANATNAFNPIHGFTLLVDELAMSGSSPMGHALNQWVRSDGNTIPPIVTQHIHERISWQRPKAIICSILFVIFLLVSTFAWKTLIAKKRANPKWKLTEAALLTVGVVAVMLSLLLMVVAVANTQAAIAPVTITVLGANG